MALGGKNVKEPLSNVDVGGRAPTVGATPVADAAAAEETKEEEKGEGEKEESDDDMVYTRQPDRFCVTDRRHRFIGLWAIRLVSFGVCYLIPVAFSFHLA